MNLKKNVFPQAAVDKFLERLHKQDDRKDFTILPGNVRAKRAALRASIHAKTPSSAMASYEQAAQVCETEIDNIDCLRMNFDIELDLSRWLRCHRVEDYLGTTW